MPDYCTNGDPLESGPCPNQAGPTKTKLLKAASQQKSLLLLVEICGEEIFHDLIMTRSSAAWLAQ